MWAENRYTEAGEGSIEQTCTSTPTARSVSEAPDALPSIASHSVQKTKGVALRVVAAHTGASPLRCARV